MQEDLAKEYVVGWIRYSMLSDWPQANLFNGTTANSGGVPVSLMWKFGRDLKTIERYQDTDPTTNTLAGHVGKPGYDFASEFDFGLDLILTGLDSLRASADRADSIGMG